MSREHLFSCDRCGKRQKTGSVIPDDRLPEGWGRVSNEGLDQPRTETTPFYVHQLSTPRSFDLCRECRHELKNWFSGQGNVVATAQIRRSVELVGEVDRATLLLENVVRRWPRSKAARHILDNHEFPTAFLEEMDG